MLCTAELSLLRVCPQHSALDQAGQVAWVLVNTLKKNISPVPVVRTQLSKLRSANPTRDDCSPSSPHLRARIDVRGQRSQKEQLVEEGDGSGEMGLT